jgi:hypothetical protein
MARSRKEHTRLLFGAIPWWIYELLENGYITGPEYIIWTAIRGYVKDEDHGTFSPPLIDLTNREIARATALTTERVRDLLKSLEEKLLLYRMVGQELRDLDLGGNRWLLLLAPQSIPQNYPQEIRGGNITRGINTPGINNNNYSSPKARKTSRDSTSEGNVVIESSSRKGGLGEKVNNPQEIRGGNNTGGNNTPGNDTQGNNTRGIDWGEKRVDVAAILQELGAFPGPAFDIADQMLAAERFSTLTGGELLTEVQDTFYRVYRQSEQGACNEHEAMRFTITRLRNGDWGDRATATQEKARLQRLEQHMQVSYRAEEPSLSEAEKLWNETLRELELQMTKGTFDTWLRGSKALRINGDGNTLVVQVRNAYAIEWLENRLYSLISRTLRYNLTYSDEPEPPLDPDQFKVTFVVENTTEEEVP